MRHADLSADEGQSVHFQLSERAHEGLRMLTYAYSSARDSGGKATDFALSIDELLETGMKKCDIRWLVRKEFVRHFVEFAIPGQLRPKLRSTRALKLFESSCFVLSASGVEFVSKVLDQPALTGRQVLSVPNTNGPNNKPRLPLWDKERRELSVDGRIIRSWSGRRSHQELLIIAFHEQGFADRIDDPLPQTVDICSTDRLYTVVRRLNKSIRGKLIQFRCTPDKTGVLWEFTQKKHRLNKPATNARIRLSSRKQKTQGFATAQGRDIERRH